ncbi:MAG TPA: pirin family protein [Pyrinomonadaceae bacterium]|nr:pirin family protein [Pyrinomonadaceae bacterium]
MITIRKAEDRGHFDHGWLDTYHTFSFDRYHDRRHMSFGSLRVINEDRVAAGHGFPTHSHRDMEIITYVLEGSLAHKDSMGNGSIIKPGEVQRMTAGTGVAHSEANPANEPLHLLQIWILPHTHGLDPGYEQKMFTDDLKQGKLCLIASEDGRDGSVTIHQEADVYSTRLEAGQTVSHQLGEKRKAWLQVARGRVTLNGVELDQGDGAAISDESKLEISGREAAEVLLFDMA